MNRRRHRSRVVVASSFAVIVVLLLVAATIAVYRWSPAAGGGGVSRDAQEAIDLGARDTAPQHNIVGSAGETGCLIRAEQSSSSTANYAYDGQSFRVWVRVAVTRANISVNGVSRIIRRGETATYPGGMRIKITDILVREYRNKVFFCITPPPKTTLTATIAATPNPCMFDEGQFVCYANISWSASGVTRPVVQIRADGVKFSCGEANSPKSKPSWIGAVPKFFTIHPAVSCETDTVDAAIANVSVVGMTATPPPSVECPQADADRFDVSGNDALLPIGSRMLAARILPSWKDADTGFVVNKEAISNTYPITETNPQQRQNRYFGTAAGSPSIRWGDDGELLMTMYGQSTRDPLPNGSANRSVGDSTMLMRLYPQSGGGFTIKRYREARFAFLPDPGNRWSNQGGLGTGMKFTRVTTTQPGGWKYVGVLGIHDGPFEQDGQPAGRDLIAQTVSRDGVEWFLIKPDGGLTKDPHQARPFIRYEHDVPRRNLHETVFFSDPVTGGDGYVYILFGQTLTGHGRTTFAIRYKHDPTTHFGVPVSATPFEIWYNGECDTVPGHSYNPVGGRWIPFDGTLSEDMMGAEGLRRYQFLWDSVDPLDLIALKKPDGSPNGLLYLYADRDAYGLPQVSYRVSVNQKWPFVWGPKGYIDFSNLYAAGYAPGSAGGLDSSAFQVGGKLYLVTTTSPGPILYATAVEGQDRFFGFTHTWPVLKIVQVWMSAAGTTQGLDGTLPSWR